MQQNTALQVHNVQVSSQVRLGLGKATPVTHLSFYVGDHGPFTEDFVAPGDTISDIQAFIRQKVADLRTIMETQY